MLKRFTVIGALAAAAVVGLATAAPAMATGGDDAPRSGPAVTGTCTIPPIDTAWTCSGTCNPSVGVTIALQYRTDPARSATTTVTWSGSVHLDNNTGYLATTTHEIGDLTASKELLNRPVPNGSSWTGTISRPPRGHKIAVSVFGGAFTGADMDCVVP